jgi:hypothetical protein
MAGPWLLPIAGAVVGGGVAAAKGGSFGDIAKGALLGGATGGVASGIGTALGVGASTAGTAGAAKTAAAALSPQERLLQAAVGNTSTAGTAAKAAAGATSLDNAMKYAGYANTTSNLIGQLTGSAQQEQQTQFLQPQAMELAQIPQEDLYQQLLRLSKQG